MQRGTSNGSAERAKRWRGVVWAAVAAAVLVLAILLGCLHAVGAAPFEVFATPILVAAFVVSLAMALRWREWRALPVSLVVALLLGRLVAGFAVRAGYVVRTAPVALLEDMLLWAAIPAGLAAIAYLWRIFENQSRLQSAQRALRESEKQYRHFIENATEAVLRADAAGTIVLANPGAARLFGLPQIDLLGRDYFDLIPLDTIADVKGALDLQRKGKVAASYHEFRLADPDGKDRWVGQNLQALSEGQQPSGFQVVLRDVTERRRAQEALRQSEALLRTLFETMSEGVALMGADARIVFVNPAAAQILGASREDLRGRTFADGAWEFLREDRTAVPAEEWIGTRAMAQQEAVQNVVMALRREDGSLVWLNTSAVPIMRGGETADGAVVTLTDISRKWEADEDFRTVEFALDNALEHVYLVARDGRIIYGNKHGRASLGYTVEELLQKRIFDIDSELAPEDWAETWRRAEAGDWASFESVHVRKNGTTFPTVTWANCFEHGGKGYMFAFVLDISKETELAAQLRQSQKMEAVGTLAGGIAHDFNNILTSILGYTDLAMDDVPQDSPVFSFLEEVRRGATRAAETIQQILTFSRRREQQLHPMRLAPIVKEAVKLLRGSLPSTIEIRPHIESVESPVMTDPAQVQQVVMNLCTNAYYAMQDKGGELGVTLTETEVTAAEASKQLGLEAAHYVRLTVTDTGKGMDQETQKRMFEPFFTTKPEGEGTGLGLATVHGIVKGHKGAIRVDSRLGEGTRVDVFLPVCVGVNARETGDAEEAPVPRGTECVLLVDDEEKIAESFALGLERLGYTVDRHASAAEAIEGFTRDPARYDIVVTDQMMPGVAGADLAGQLHAVRPEVPILICTGFADSVPAEQAAAAGVREVLKKPISARDLASAIRRAVASAEAGD